MLMFRLTRWGNQPLQKNAEAIPGRIDAVVKASNIFQWTKKGRHL